MSVEYVQGFGIPTLEDDDDDDNPYKKTAFQPIEEDDDGEEKKEREGGGGDVDDEWSHRNKKVTGVSEEWIDPDADPDSGWGGGKPKTAAGEARPNFEDAEDEEELQFKTFNKKEASEIAEERLLEKMQSSAAEMEAQQHEKHKAEREAEKLGDDFEDTPWVPPSTLKAMDFRAFNIFRGGAAPIGHVDVCSATDLSLGCVLHFQLMKSMAVMSFVMFWLSIPALVFSYAGSRISQVDQDSIGLYRLTLGNIGYNPASPTYKNDSSCTSLPKQYNGTCLHFTGSGAGRTLSAELTLANAGSILTATEFLQCFVFFCVVWHLRRKTHFLKRQMDKNESTVSNYSIFVDHLPKDTTMEQLVAHFTNLYPLDTADWRHRPPVVGAEKVIHCENTGLPVHLNTWVAECTLYKRIGKLICKFKNVSYLTERLRALRARIKMYSDDTPHPKGPQARKRLDMVDKYIAVGTRLDNISRKLRKRHFRTVDLDPELAMNDRLPFSERIDAPVVCAFVVFQYTESMARCVEDYRRFSTLPWSILYPDKLKFRGHRIQVHQAPQPDSINWENLEVSKVVKRLKRARTVVLAIVLILVAFAIDLQATAYKRKLSDSTPSVSACSSYIPELYSQANASTISESAFANVKIQRAPVLAGKRTLLDAQCTKLFPSGSVFYATYFLRPDGSNNNNLKQAVGNYDFAACTQETAQAKGLPYWGLCPQVGQTVFCPCASLTDNTVCSSKVCSVSPTSGDCVHFPASSMGSCMCVAELTNKLQGGDTTSSGGDALSQVQALEKDTCGLFYLNYSTSLALIYVSALVSVLVSLLLAWFMKRLAVAEDHNSLDAAEGSKMTKLFLSQYVTLCVIIVISYGRIDGLPELIREGIGIFNGPYTDFTAAWYGNVGNFLVVTFLLRFMIQYGSDCYELYLSLTFTRLFNAASIEAQRNSTYVTQDEVNKLYVGRKFDVATRTAATLVTVFYMMTFATGLPVLVPLACLFLVLELRIQKRLLLRHESKPDHMDAKIMISVIDVLPYAAMIRIAIACWMYGNPDVFESPGMALAAAAGAGGDSAAGPSVGGVSAGSAAGAVDTGALSSMLAANAAGKSDNYLYVSMIQRASNSNVIPLIALLALIVGAKVFSLVWRELPFNWLMKTLWGLVCHGRTDKVYVTTDSVDAEGNITQAQLEAVNGYDLVKHFDHLRLDAAPYTGDYYKYVRDKEAKVSCMKRLSCCCNYDPDDVLNEEDMALGWEVADQGDRYVVKIKTWKNGGMYMGAVHARGAPKKTYEMVSDNSVHTYNLEEVPSYKSIMHSIRECCLSEDIHSTEFVGLVAAYKARVIEMSRARTMMLQNLAVWEQGEHASGNDRASYFSSLKKSKGAKEGKSMEGVDYDAFDEDYGDDGYDDGYGGGGGKVDANEDFWGDDDGGGGGGGGDEGWEEEEEEEY